MEQFQPITWCFDKNLEQAKEKISKACRKMSVLEIYTVSLIKTCKIGP